jgi:hypothetical protein
MDQVELYTKDPLPVWVLPVISLQPIVHGENMGKKYVLWYSRKLTRKLCQEKAFYGGYAEGAIGIGVVLMKMEKALVLRLAVKRWRSQ